MTQQQASTPEAPRALGDTMGVSSPPLPAKNTIARGFSRVGERSPPSAPPCSPLARPRLYFDAEAEEGVSEPMSSSLAVLELPVVTAVTNPSQVVTECTQASGAGVATATPPECGGEMSGAWASTQWAWYPDAAYICCGRPGHYQVSLGFRVQVLGLRVENPSEPSTLVRLSQ